MLGNSGIFSYLVQKYRKSCCTIPLVGRGVGVWGSISVSKMLCHIKFLRRARRCQAGYPVRGKVLFN